MAKKKKEFIRKGNVVAFAQAGFEGWWTVLAEDGVPNGQFQVYASADALPGEADPLDNLIDVLNKIKKQGEL